MHIKKLSLAFCFAVFCLIAIADDATKIIEMLDRSAGEKNNSGELETLSSKLSSNPDKISEQLTRRLESGELTENQKVVYRPVQIFIRVI